MNDYKSMTVAELLQKLSKVPQDYRVDIPTGDFETNGLLKNDLLLLHINDEDQSVSLVCEETSAFLAEDNCDCCCDDCLRNFPESELN